MKKYLILSLFMLLLTLFSCEDYLNEKMNPAISNEYLNTEAGAIKNMNAIYQAMKSTYGPEITVTFNVFGTDEFVNGSDGNYKPIGMYTDINPTTDIFWTMWDSWYKVINNCNVLIDNIPTIPSNVVFIDESKRTGLLGEALFMRAFYYYHIVLNFGSVPMPLKGNLGDIQTTFTREPTSKIWSQIIADLRKAADYLPVSQTENGRATKGAAQMLLSRAYLARVSVPVERMPKASDLDSVIYFTSQVIQSNQYELLDNYKDVFDGQNDINKEIIFSVQNTPDLIFNGNGNSLHMYWYSNYEAEPGMQRATEAGGRSYKRAMPTDFLMDVYDRKNDSRFYKSFLLALKSNNAATIPKLSDGTPKFNLGDTSFYYTLDWVNVDFNVIKTLTDYNNLLKAAKSKYLYDWHPRNDYSVAFEKEMKEKVSTAFALDRRYFLTFAKHLDFFRPEPQNKAGQNNIILIRFAEAYIMRAEAYGRKNDFVNAAIDLNVIRQRAAYKIGEVKPQENWRSEGGIIGDLTPTYSNITLTDADIQKGFDGQGDFIDFILDEMSREFSGECRRWMDLARFGRLVDRVTKYNIDAAPFIKDYHELRPIPANHIDRLIPTPPLPEVQNPGYY